MNTRFNIGDVVFALNGSSVYKGEVIEIRVDGNAKKPKVQYELKSIGRFNDEFLYATFDLLVVALKEKMDGN